MGTHGYNSGYTAGRAYNRDGKQYKVYGSQNGERDMKALTKAAEHETRKYYENTLYKYLIETGIVSDVITDVPAELDLKGVDVILVLKNGDMVPVDEKGQFMYLNDPRGTWSYEVAYNDARGDRVEGWFLLCEPGHPDQHLTQYFALSYIDNVDTNQLEDYTADKIKQTTVLFVKVSDIIDWMEKKGKTFDDLWYDAEDAREQYASDRDMLMRTAQWNALEDIRRVHDKAYAVEGDRDEAYYYVSDGKKDVNSDPTNLIIRRKVLENFPNSREFVVTPDRVFEKDIHHEGLNIAALRNDQLRRARLFKSEPDKTELQTALEM